MKRPGNDFVPSFTDSSGSNYFERDSMFLHVVSVNSVIIYLAMARDWYCNAICEIIN